MLYRVLRRMIEKGNTDGMEEKLAVFYAVDKLTQEQYTELVAMLKK